MLEHGAIAGYRATMSKVVVYDGKSHPVDSAGSSVRRRWAEGLSRRHQPKRWPIVLEPIVNITRQHAGELHRRHHAAICRPSAAQVSGTHPTWAPGWSALRGRCHLSELNGYQSRLKSITGGAGSFSIELLTTKRCRRWCSRTWYRNAQSASGRPGSCESSTGSDRWVKSGKPRHACGGSFRPMAGHVSPVTATSATASARGPFPLARQDLDHRPRRSSGGGG